jgi:hypothetical protein
MNNSLQKFQDLLRELFQFDSVDLDFGIYRIMNHKRDAIERFINEDLPKTVIEELERDALAAQAQAVQELEGVTAQIKQALGIEAIDANGNLNPAYHNTPLGRKYLDTKSKAAGARGREALEATIYNHLYAFFSRYYQDGDFISKRRYDASGQQAMKFDDYLLQYMLKWETRASETLLHVEKLSEPFHYKLHIHANGQTRERLVDLPETFNYLLGLHVQRRRVYIPPSPSRRGDGGEVQERRYLVYRGTIDQRRGAILWRETRDWQKADFERDRDFVAEDKLTEGADEIFVNGDSLIPGARALEPVFKARMFAPVEA